MPRPKKKETEIKVDTEVNAVVGESNSEAETTPKKRGRKPKTNAAEDSSSASPKCPAGPVNGGSWSNPAAISPVPMHYMHVEIMWTENALGTSPSNKQLLTDYIASRAPDAMSREEEIAQYGKNETMNKFINIYPKGKFLYDPEKCRFWDPNDARVPLPEDTDSFEEVENHPFLWNYQIRGFMKDSCGLLSRSGKDASGENESAKLSAFKKVIDGCIFVHPRRIGIQIPETFLDDDGVTIRHSFDENGQLNILQRPMISNGPNGQNVAIAASEMIPKGSSIKFTIGMTSLKFKPAVIEWLNYACVHGISGWRNSGMGTCIWREIQPDYTPFPESN